MLRDRSEGAQGGRRGVKVRSAAAIPRLKEPVEKYGAAKKKVPVRLCEKAVSGTK
jgi:hypothetical protein